MNQKAVSALFLILSQAVNVVLLFLFTPYLVRALPREMYGSYSQALFLTEFTGILFTMAILQTAMVFFNDKKYSFPDSLKTIVVFTLGAGVLALLALEVFSIPAPHIFRNELLGPYLRIYAFSLLGSKLNLVLNQALIHQGKSRQLMILSVSSNLLKLCLALLAIQKFHSM
ncbi:MAG TPA: oligosaccharide flippase family protein, partial [Chitinophagaceae bacterium]|nr:oligosaccharide flippase family protein [Chitinophagaceae bacterium]